MALLRVDYTTPADPGNTLESLNLEKVSGASVTLDQFGCSVKHYQ